MQESNKVSRNSLLDLPGIRKLQQRERVLGKWNLYVSSPGMIILPIILIEIFIYKDFNITNYSSSLKYFSSVVYGVLILNTLLILYDASISSTGLKRVLDEYYIRGKPIKSIRGMDEVLEELNQERKDAAYVVILAFLSLAFFWAGAIFSTIFFLSMGLISIAMGFGTLLNITDTPKLQPGGLLEYHEPTLFPVMLDNIMKDVIEAFLSPVDLLFFDEFQTAISSEMKWTPKHAITRQTALERTIEKIFLLNYLTQQLPEFITDDVVIKELTEVLNNPNTILDFPSFPSGVIQQVFHNMGINAEGLFKLITKLFVGLNENLDQFKQTELYIDMAVPDVTIGLSKINLFILLINLSNESKYKDGRPLKITISAEGFLPAETSINVILDPSEKFEIKSTKLEIAANGGEDVLGVMTNLLQIGDAFWIQLEPQYMGKQILTVKIIDPVNNRLIIGKNLVSEVRFDTLALVRALVGKASAYVGLAFSAVKFLLGSDNS